MSCGNISSDCPMPYQLCSEPLRPCTPNSGYSLANTGGSEVQNEWVDCSRCIVSAGPTPHDSTTNAMSPAARLRKKIGLRNQLWMRLILKRTQTLGNALLTYVSIQSIARRWNSISYRG